MYKKILALVLFSGLLLPYFHAEAMTIDDVIGKVKEVGKKLTVGASSAPLFMSEKEANERVLRIKMRQRGIAPSASTEVFEKIEAAQARAQKKISSEIERLKQADRAKRAEEDTLIGEINANQKELQFASSVRLPGSASSVAPQAAKSFNERKALFEKGVQKRDESIALTKKKPTEIETLRQLNQELQKALDAELKTALTPNELMKVGRVEANYLYSLDDFNYDFPNDTEINRQWEIGAVLSQFEDHFSETASTTIDRVLIAVIDAGVDYTHEDLVGHIYNPTTCFDETGTTTPNGCPYGGWDFIDDDNDPKRSSQWQYGRGCIS